MAVETATRGETRQLATKDDIASIRGEMARGFEAIRREMGQSATKGDGDFAIRSARSNDDTLFLALVFSLFAASLILIVVMALIVVATRS